HLDVEWVPARERLAAALLDVIRPGDLVVVLGAGDIYRTGEELVQTLRARGVGLRAV
ncbi:MAG: UDP-N-acetylmuramate--alanine ligase, partial [Candidatus Binatota bacterium]|nr:UDP-N-acetylmuramate--alanine ligase [Candidatus Binatota bacterium]